MPLVSEKIIAQRLLLKLTQQELSELSGVSVRLLRELESGRGNPGLRQLEKLAIALNLTLTLIPKTDEAASR